MKMFPHWVSIEPRLLPLARRNGFGMLDDWREVVLKKIFTTSMNMHHPPDVEASTLAKLVLELTELDPAMYPSTFIIASRSVLTVLLVSLAVHWPAPYAWINFACHTAMLL